MLMELMADIMQLALSLFKIFVLLAILTSVLIFFFQEKLLYMPFTPGQAGRSPDDNIFGYRNPKEKMMLYDEVWLTCKDGIRVHGWLLRVQNTTSAPTILFFHGNAGNIGYRMDSLSLFYTEMKANILIIDYRGYGKSDGTPSEKGLILDAEAAIVNLVDNPDINSHRIFLYGRSLGGGLAIHIAHKFPQYVQGIILENTFMNIKTMVDEKFAIFRPLKFLLRMNWPNIELIKDIHRPILFISAAQDEIIPTHHSYDLYAAAINSVYKDLHSVKNGTHNDCHIAGGRGYVQRINDFMLKVLRDHPAPHPSTIFNDTSFPCTSMKKEEDNRINHIILQEEVSMALQEGSEAANLRLRREIIHLKETVEDLQEELQERDERLIKYEEERDKNNQMFEQARDTLMHYEDQVSTRVQKATKDQEVVIMDLKIKLEENQALLESANREVDSFKSRERQTDSEIQYLEQQLDKLAQTPELQQAMRDVKLYRDATLEREKEIERLTQVWNDLGNQMDDLIAENRVLRQMAEVPENFGINFEEIKIANRLKMEDYKSKLRYYENEVEELERERTKLRWRLRQMSAMCEAGVTGERYQDLTQEQWTLLDMYVLNIKDGTAQMPGDNIELRRENEQLKAQLKIIKEQGYHLVESQVEKIIKKMGGSQNRDVLEEIRAENGELRKLLMDLTRPGAKGFDKTGTMGFTRTGAIGPGTGTLGEGGRNLHLLELPPQPIVQSDGHIQEGISYRYQGHLIVRPFDPDKYIDGKLSRKDFASVQLQLVECLNLLGRKNDDQGFQTKEMEGMNRKLREVIMVEDQLYRDFATRYATWVDEIKQVKDREADTAEKLRAEQIKTKDMDRIVQAIQTQSRTELERTLIELTKKNSINDVNLIRLTRKYHCLDEEFKIMKNAYHNLEKDYEEKDTLIEEKLGKLKEWKARALHELKYLYHKLRESVPLLEYEQVQKKYATLREKEASWIIKNAELMQKISDSASYKRELSESLENIRGLEEMRLDTEAELEIVKRRLEQADAEYAWEQSIMNRIIISLKRYRISPQQAFELFDKNRDGRISRQELKSALSNMKIDVSNNDVGVLLNSLDVDSEGLVRYKSFVNRLKRYGVRSRTTQEQIIFTISDAIRKAGLEMDEAFSYLDTDGDGIISRKEFITAFQNMRLGLQDDDLNQVLNFLFPDSQTGTGIDYKKFVQLFKRRSQVIEKEERKLEQGQKMDWKTELFMKIDNSLQKLKIDFRDAFNAIDENEDGKVSKAELKQMIQKMQIEITESELSELFGYLDTDSSGFISYIEFGAELHAAHRRAMKLMGKARGTGGSQAADFTGEMTNLSQAKTKIAVLHERESHAVNKYQKQAENLARVEAQLHREQKENSELQRKLEDLMKNYLVGSDRQIEMELKMKNAVTMEEGQLLKIEQSALKKEITEARAAMTTYRNMYESAVNQVRTLKLSLERRRDETHEMQACIRDLQVNSGGQQLVAKLYYLIMLSRWQEASSNKKYESSLGDLRRYRIDLYNSEKQIDKYEVEVSMAEKRLEDHVFITTQMRDELKARKNIHLTIEKFQVLSNQIQELTYSKIEIEEGNIKLREDNIRLGYTLDESETKRVKIEDLLQVLKTKTQSELGNKVIVLSETMSEYKLQALRSARESAMAKEREIYLERINQTNIATLNQLEEEVATINSKLHQKEEEFRRRDAERQRMVFDFKARDLGGTDKDIYKDKGSIEFSREKTEDIPLFMRKNEDPSAPRISGIENEKLKERIHELEEQLRTAITAISSKERMIDKWQVQDETAFSGDQGLKRILEERTQKNAAAQEEETRQLAEAAHKTIQTLQKMIESQNTSLSRKDEIIRDQRQEMLREKELDQLEIAKLNEQLSGVGKEALGRLVALTKEETKVTSAAKYAAIGRLDMMSQTEIQQLLFEKDNRIKSLLTKISGMEAESKFFKDKIREIRGELDVANGQVIEERRKNKQSAAKREVRQMDKLLRDKTAELDKTKVAILELKKDIIKFSALNEKKEEDMNAKALSEKNNNQEMDAKVKQATTTIRDLTKQMKSAEMELQKLKEKNRLRDEEDKIREEEDVAAATLREKRGQHQKVSKEELDKVKHELARVKVELEKYKKVVEDQGLRPKEDILDILKAPERHTEARAAAPQQAIKYNSQEGYFESSTTKTVQEEKITDLGDLLVACRNEINEKINPLQIFESYDKSNVGYIYNDIIPKIFEKLGISLRATEKSLITNSQILQGTQPYTTKYRIIARSLHPKTGNLPLPLIYSGIAIMSKKIVETVWDNQELKSYLDPQHKIYIPKSEFVSKQGSLDGDKMSVEEKKKMEGKFVDLGQVNTEMLIEYLLEGVNAVLVDNIKVHAVEHTVDLITLFTRFDSNHDHVVTYLEFDRMLENIGVGYFGKNIERLRRLLNPGEKNNNITLENYSVIFGLGTKKIQEVILKEETKLEDEVHFLIKKIAKKILNTTTGMYDLFTEADIDHDGVLKSEQVFSVIEGMAVADLKMADIHKLIKYQDKKSKGYISYDNMLKMLYEQASESKNDALLRSVGNIIRRKDINLRIALGGYDPRMRGKLPEDKFGKAMRNLNIGLSEHEIDILTEIAKGNSELIDIDRFCEQLSSILAVKPVPISNLGPGNILESKWGTESTMAPGSATAINTRGSNLERKYQRKLEAFKAQIAEQQKEIDNGRREITHYMRQIEGANEEKRRLGSKLAERDNSRMTKKGDFKPAFTLQQLESVQELRDQIYELQNRNTKLEKTLEVDMKTELSTTITQNNKLKDEIKMLKLENFKLESKMEQYIGKKMDSLQLREEKKFGKAMKLKNLERKLEETEIKNESLESTLLRTEKTNLELQFEKESFELQYSRLQKRIRDLEQYKMTSSKYSTTKAK